MGFAQSHPAINKQRIIKFAEIFNYRLSRGLSQFIERTNNKISQNVYLGLR